MKKLKELFNDERRFYAFLGLALSIMASVMSVGLGGRFYVSIIEGVAVAMAAGIGTQFGEVMRGGEWDNRDVMAAFVGAVIGAVFHIGLMWASGAWA